MAERSEGSAVERPALARCVADPGGFGSYWSQRPLHSAAASLPRQFDDLLDLRSVDELLSRRGLRTPFLRMVKDGVVVDPARFTRSGGVGAEVADQVADDAVAALFSEGATAVLQGLHRVWPPVIDFATQLGIDLGHPVQVNAYVTPPSSRGFSAHYDLHDVFVLQFAGEKRWIVHEPVLEAPLRSQPWGQRRAAVEAAARDREPALNVVLRPGDALYLPRGWLHAAEALGEIAGHLTVGIHVITRYAILEALLALARDEVELRQSLPLGIVVSDPDALGPHVEATVRALSSRVESATPEDVAEALRDRVWRSTRPAPLAPLEQATAIGQVQPGLRVRLRPGSRARLRDGAVPQLVLPDRTLELDAASLEPARALLDGAVHELDELPGDPDETAVLVRRLLYEGVIVPADG